MQERHESYRLITRGIRDQPLECRSQSGVGKMVTFSGGERDANRVDQSEAELRGETEVEWRVCLGFPEITGDIERPQSVFERAQSF